jgi:glycosyltransferase involved in cell wall biosynthesis
MKRALHQFLAGATAGDAITEQALLMRRWLRELGFASEVYALHVEPSVEEVVLPLGGYRRGRDESQAVYHHSIGSDVADRLLEVGLPLILVYHNVTPPEFFLRTEPALAYLSRRGSQQLAELRPRTALALADSTFNAADLRREGYDDIAVMPITLQTERYDLPPDEALAARLDGERPRLVFVGRLSANKRQEDLVKLLYYVRRARPRARLDLVGAPWQPGYSAWIAELAAELGVGDGLTLTGKVTQQEMVTYLRTADVYVSMSEHEGFGMPLIESMYVGVPVLAYDVAAVGETMGGAGVLFRRKEYEYLAEVVVQLLEDGALRERLITRQRRRAADFLEPRVREQFVALLREREVC